MRKLLAVGLGLAGACVPLVASAQGVEVTAEDVADTGDTAWILISTALVLMMTMPGLTLFYGGLVRTKNMASVLTQVLAVAAFAMLLWVMYGYGLAFGPEGNAFISWGKWFLVGVTTDSTAVTGSYGVTVQSLASSQFLVSPTYANGGATVGTGNLHIEFGTWDYDPASAPPSGAGANQLTPASGSTATSIASGA